MAEFIQPPAHAADSKRVLWVKLNRLLEGGGPIPPDYDPDAIAFAAATGATDVAGLSALFSGWKALALWDVSLLFPMRAGQNYGTGSALKIAGGLAAGREATLVNGPAWSAGGLVFDGVNDYVATGIADFTTAQSIGAAYLCDSTTGTANDLVGNTNSANGGIEVRFSNNSGVVNIQAYTYSAGVDVITAGSLSARPLNTWMFVQTTHPANGVTVGNGTSRKIDSDSRVGTNPATGGPKDSGLNYIIGARNTSSQHVRGTIAFVYIIEGLLDEPKQNAINDLVISLGFLS